MVFNSIGGVKVKRLGLLPRFFKLTFRARKAALAHEGCVGMDLSRAGRVFFAHSVWTSKEAMHDYARGETHGALLRERRTLFHFTHNVVIESETPMSRDEAQAAWHRAFPMP